MLSIPDGFEILEDKVYSTHDSPPQPVDSHDQLLYNVIHEIFLQSLTFRERGAGQSLDSDMNHQGFNNQIGIEN